MSRLKFLAKNDRNTWPIPFKTEAFFAGIFTAILVLGYILSNGGNVGQSSLPAYILGFFTIYLTTFLLLCTYRSYSLKQVGRPRRTFLDQFSDRKLWVLLTIGLFLSFIPIILASISEMTYDSWSSINQVTGAVPLSAAHPVIYTGFIGIFVNLGLFLGNITYGLLLHSLAQSLILAVIFSLIIVKARGMGVGKHGIIAMLIFYGLLPINAFAGTIVWKDILFAAFGLLLIALLVDFGRNEKSFLKKKNLIWFIVIAFLFCTWRNNGIYAYVITAIFYLIQSRRFLDYKFTTLLLAPVGLFVVYTASVAMIVGTPSSSEAMSVPLQQIARTVKYHPETISPHDKAIINEILPFDKLAEKYNPGLSDPVKWLFNKQAFQKDKAKYIGLWLRLSWQHKSTFIASFLYNTYGYIYPFSTSSTTTDLVVNNADQLNTPKDTYTDVASNRGMKAVLVKYRDLVISIFPLMQNIGFYTCMILLALYTAIIRKRTELIGIFILLFALFLTVIMGPVNGEFRYLYLFTIATPFIFASAFSAQKVSTNRRVVRQ